MPNISLRFVGLGDRASGSREEARCVPEGTTLREVCDGVGSAVDGRAGLILEDAGPVSIVLNGELLRRTEELAIVLEEGDVVAFMVLATGG